MDHAPKDFQTPERDDYGQDDSDIVAALIRLWPHLSPDLQEAIHMVVRDGTDASTLH